MRSLVAAVLALLALAPACESEPEPNHRLDRLADNECGEAARCMIEECSDVEGTSDEDACTATCRSANPCAADDLACQEAFAAYITETSSIYTFCASDDYTDEECEAGLEMCDGVQDPVPST